MRFCFFKKKFAFFIKILFKIFLSLLKKFFWLIKILSSFNSPISLFTFEFKINNFESLIEKCGAGKILYVISGDKLIFKLNSDDIWLERTFWTLPELYKLGIDR